MLPRAQRPVILMYHRISADSFDPWGLCVTARNFADQLRWLAANRTVLPLEELCERHSAGTLPADAAAITFDDGYESTATIAAPLLEQFHLPATVFLSAALVRHGRPFWWDELRQLVLEHAEQSLAIDNEAVVLGEREAGDALWRPGEEPQTARQQAFLHLWSVLLAKDPSSLGEAMNELRSQVHHLPHDAIEGPMSADQVRAIASCQIRFGSHAMTHASLPDLNGSAKASEIRDSIEACEELAGARPLTFAYPYGRFDRQSE